MTNQLNPSFRNFNVMDQDLNINSDQVPKSSVPSKPSGRCSKHYQKRRNNNAAQRKQDATRRKFGLLALENRRKQREQLLYPNGPPDRMDVVVPLGLKDATLTPCHFSCFMQQLVSDLL